MVNAAPSLPMSPKKVLSRQSPIPLLLALVYLVFLITPWVFTYKIARNPASLVRATGSRFLELGWGDVIEFGDFKTFSINYSRLLAVNILNSVAVVLSLPILSALLARAAVVFSQRRKINEKLGLSVRQLFALADRGWWNVFLVLQKSTTSILLICGWVLLVLAFVLPLTRSALIRHQSVVLELDGTEWYVNQHALGISPSPGLLQSANQDELVTYTRMKLQTTTGGIETNLWPYCNDNNISRYWDRTCGFDFNPYDLTQSSISNYWELATEGTYSTNGSALMFASSIPAGSTTGYALDGYALGIKSGAMCEQASLQQVTDACDRAASGEYGWNTSMLIPEQLSIDICVPGVEDPPWAAAAASSPWKPFEFVEYMYIGIQEQVESDGYQYGQWGMGEDNSLGDGTALYMYCQAETALQYFRLGNDSSQQVPSPFLNETLSDFNIPNGTRAATTTESTNSSPPLGPLMTTAQALFGNDSWFSTIQQILNVAPNNQTELQFIVLLCQLMPLNQASYFDLGFTSIYCSDIGLQDVVDNGPVSENLAKLIRYFFYSFSSPRMARAIVNTGTFFANSDLLSQVLPQYPPYSTNMSNMVLSYDAYETEPLIPVVSTHAFVAITVLIALQVLSIILLLLYIYSTPVWTKTLDAMALVSLGAQLSGLDIFHSAGHGGTPLGPSDVSPTGREKLFRMDGLIDITAVPLVPVDTTADHGGLELEAVPPPYTPREMRPVTDEERRMSSGSVPLYSPLSGAHSTPRRSSSEAAESVSGHGDRSMSPSPA